MNNREINLPASNNVVDDPIGRACGILTSVSRSRATIYRWLSLGFYPPDREWVEAVNREQLTAELTDATSWLGADQQKLLLEIEKLAGHQRSPLEEWQAEYNRLFGKSIQYVSPREGSYRWRDVLHMTETTDNLTAALQQEYHQFGLLPLTGMEDTVAVECEFLAYLCERETENWAAHSMSSARELRQQQRNFLINHLGLWFPEFSRNVTDCAADSFYDHLASFGNIWLSFEYGAGYLGVA
ncbi:MAG: molecular chaperone TorD family protein [Chloroflexi bacterium]|nr:molecular chaperone TorD family protein [Chloroflexota bacterium]